MDHVELVERVYQRVEEADQLGAPIGDLCLTPVSTSRCIGSKWRRMRSTPTESVSIRLKLLVCLAGPG